MAQQCWVPLESNPEVINKYLVNLGVSGKAQCYDLIGFDEEALSAVPNSNKAAAVLFLYPASEKIHEASKKLTESQADEGSGDGGVYFIKQNVKNACGSIALIHALANNAKVIDTGSGCFHEFYEKTKSASPDEKATLLEKDQEMKTAHEKSAAQGDTAPPQPEADVDFHYIALVNHSGVLYELDGRKEHPIKHGPTTDESFFKDAAAVCKSFMELEPENIRFHALALTIAN